MRTITHTFLLIVWRQDLFLNRNNALFREGHKVISDGALVAITLMIAESDPKEKDIMTTMVMNLLSEG